MSLRVAKRGIVGEDGAQALTEFVLIIPVVLLFFFVMIQSVVILLTSQLCNYAAYVAARSYSVHENIEGPAGATTIATRAAALALAPGARLVPGEVFGLPVGTLSSLLPDWVPGRCVAELGEGWWVAENIRLNNSVGGGGVICTEKRKPDQVDVDLSYPQPIFIPGLAELWAFVAGDKGIHHSLSELRSGLCLAWKRMKPRRQPA